jgi:hypothetical protein
MKKMKESRRNTLRKRRRPIQSSLLNKCLRLKPKKDVRKSLKNKEKERRSSRLRGKLRKLDKPRLKLNKKK